MAVLISLPCLMKPQPELLKRSEQLPLRKRATRYGGGLRDEMEFFDWSRRELDDGSVFPPIPKPARKRLEFTGTTDIFLSQDEGFP